MGADADVTIYTPDENSETMFELPRYVIKAGEVIVEEGDIRDPVDWSHRCTCSRTTIEKAKRTSPPGLTSSIRSVSATIPVPVEYLQRLGTRAVRKVVN